MLYLDKNYIYDKVKAALEEDAPYGDITSLFTQKESSWSKGRIWAKEDLVVSGMDVAQAAFDITDASCIFTPCVEDGDAVKRGETLAFVEGPSVSLLTAERIALNFLQRMSGIATMTRRYVEAVSHTRARITDTRKTTPLLRLFEKYAVRCGGGFNHRTGLSDGILIKDNHIAAAGGITCAVEAARSMAAHTLRIEVEIKSPDQLEEALASGAEIIMLDNFTTEDMKKAVAAVGGRALLEASGGINLETLKAVAETGVDIISSGALTHSVKAVDISLDLEE